MTVNSLPLQELVLSVKGLPRLARFLPKVVLALLVSVSAEGYKKLAVWLNDMGMPFRGGSVLPSPWGGRSPVPMGSLGCTLTHSLGPQKITGWKVPMRSTSSSRSSW